MSGWSSAQLQALAAEFSLRLAVGADGFDGPNVEIGMVVVDEVCFVRAQRGTASQWYRAAVRDGHGSIRVADSVINVRAVPAHPSLADQIDAAYRTKYGSLASFAAGPRVREATLAIMPA